MEVVVSIASIVIAVSALLMTYVQIEQTRIHNRISVEPWLSFNFNRSNNECSDLGMYFLLKSTGLGPAIIEETEYCIKDSCTDNANKFINYVRELADVPRNDYSESSIDAGEELPLLPGDELKFLEINEFTNYDSFQRFGIVLEDFSIRVIYRSAYGERNVMTGFIDESQKISKLNIMNCPIKTMYEKAGI